MRIYRVRARKFKHTLHTIKHSNQSVFGWSKSWCRLPFAHTQSDTVPLCSRVFERTESEKKKNKRFFSNAQNRSRQRKRNETETELLNLSTNAIIFICNTSNHVFGVLLFFCLVVRSHLLCAVCVCMHSLDNNDTHNNINNLAQEKRNEINAFFSEQNQKKGTKTKKIVFENNERREGRKVKCLTTKCIV